jgi:hypothetical protein
VVLPGGHGHLRHGGYAGQSFTAKTQGGYGIQQLRVVQLAGGVPMEGQNYLIGGNARSIVGDRYALYASAADFHRNTGSAGIYRVFDQFLDDGDGTFNYLTGRYLSGNILGELPD